MDEQRAKRVAAIRTMLEADPDNAETRYFLAMEYAGAGDDDAALAELGRLTGDAVKHVPAYLQAGQIHIRRGDTEKAAEVLTRGIAAADAGGPQFAHAAGEMRGFLDSIS